MKEKTKKEISQEILNKDSYYLNDFIKVKHLDLGLFNTSSTLWSGLYFIISSLQHVITLAYFKCVYNETEDWGDEVSITCLSVYSSLIVKPEVYISVTTELCPLKIHVSKF